MAAAKQKNYRESLSLFEQAVVLPSKLIRSKRVYQKFSQEKLLKEQSRKEELLNQEKRREAEKIAKSQDRKLRRRRPAVVVEGFYPAKSKIGTYADLASQGQDFSEEATGNADRVEAGLYTLIGRNFYIGERAKKSNIFAQVDLHAGIVNSKNRVRDIVAGPEQTFKNLIINEHSSESLVRAKLSVGPEWNIGDNAWLGIIAQYTEYASTAGDGLRASLPHFILSLGQKAEGYSIQMKIEALVQNLDEAKRLDQTYEFIEFKSHINSRMSLGLTVELSQFKYNNQQINVDGPDWYNRGSGSFFYYFTPALGIELKGYYQQVQGNQYNRLVDPQDGTLLRQIVFSHTDVGSVAKLNLSLNGWLSINAQAAAYNRDVQDIAGYQRNEKLALALEFPTFLTEFSGSINAFYQF